MSRIKICGLFRQEDIAYANQVMPDYAGFVLADSRRKVTTEQARKLKKLLSPQIMAVGVFVDEALDRIAACLEEGIIDMAQLHGRETEEDIQYLQAVTGKPIVKAVRVQTAYDVDAWLDSRADYLLFDGGAGEGRPFDWKLLQGVKRDFFLAGGLSRENIPRALELAKPFCIDLSSGVEENGSKNLEKMRAAVELVRGRMI